MKETKILATVLIIAGSLSLMYGSFTYTIDSHTTRVGPLALTIKDTETVNVPAWFGVGAIVAGGLLLAARKQYLNAIRT